MEPSEPLCPELALEARDLDRAVSFLEERAGLRLERLRPADGPREALLLGEGFRLRLRRPPAGPETDTAPPCDRLWVGAAASARFAPGRAGMLYRDLRPDRAGGRVVASHIRIPRGGPVPDRVHFHEVGFQVLGCVRGWVRVAYQDQGEPVLFRAGEVVVQPPGLRHRVLECSDGLEVVEVASPADHWTAFDPDLALPNEGGDPERRFSGQRFLHTGPRPGGDVLAAFVLRRFGVADAAAGAGEVWRVDAGGKRGALCLDVGRDDGFLLLFGLAGAARWRGAEAVGRLSEGDALSLAGAGGLLVEEPSRDFAALVVALPAAGLMPGPHVERQVAETTRRARPPILAGGGPRLPCGFLNQALWASVGWLTDQGYRPGLLHAKLALVRFQRALVTVREGDVQPEPRVRRARRASVLGVLLLLPSSLHHTGI